MWKRRFRVGHPSRTESRRCENKAFVPDFSQKVTVEEVKTKLKVELVKPKLSCETSLKNWKVKMQKRSFCARLPAKNWQLLDVKTATQPLVPMRGWLENDRSMIRGCLAHAARESFEARFVVAKKRFHAPASLKKGFRAKKWKWKVWNWCFRVGHPSSSESRRCESFRARLLSTSDWQLKGENEAFVRDCPH